MKQCQEMEQNWTGWENLKYFFAQFLTTSVKFLFVEERLDTGPCLLPFL